MMRRNQPLRAVLMVAVAVAAGMLCWSLIREQKSGLSDLWQEQFGNIRADLTLKDIRYSRLTPSGTRWAVKASRAMIYENSDILDLYKVAITFNREKGGQIVIVADSGSYDRGKELVSLKKDVIVKFDKGERLYTDVLNYSEKQHLIWSCTPVVFRRDDGLVIKAKKMKYFVNKGLMVLKDQNSIIPAAEDIFDRRT